MRISQLIEFLTKAQNEHGDIFVENADGNLVEARVDVTPNGYVDGADPVVIIE